VTGFAAAFLDADLLAAGDFFAVAVFFVAPAVFFVAFFAGVRFFAGSLIVPRLLRQRPRFGQTAERGRTQTGV